MTVSLDGHGPAVLHLSTRLEPDGACLELGGELDLATAGHLVSACQSIGLPPGGLLRLDLAGLEFLDVAGLRALLAVHRATAEQGHRLRVCGPRPLVRRLFALTGLQDVLEVEPTPHRQAELPAQPTARGTDPLPRGLSSPTGG